MYRFLLAAIFLISLSGCGPTERSKIVGTWELARPDQVSERINSAGESADDEQPSSAMTVVFFRNGQLETQTRMGGIDSQKMGNWKFVEFLADKNILRIECQLLSQSTEHEVQFVSEDSIKWIPPNMAGTKKRMTFVRR